MSKKTLKNVQAVVAVDTAALLEELQAIIVKEDGDDVIAQAVRKLHPKEFRNDGTEMVYDNIYFVLRMSEPFCETIRKLYPYKAHEDAEGHHFEARAAKKSLPSVALAILKAYGIAVPEGYLAEQLAKLNRKYGF